MANRILGINDSPVKFTVRNTSALVANIHQFDSDVLEALRDHMTISAGLLKRRIQTLCRKDTYYMRDHVFAELSPQRLAITAGWRREDFIGKRDYKGRVMKSFYPVAVEKGWHDRAGKFHEGTPSLDMALAQMNDYIVGGVKDAITSARERAASRARR